MPDNDDGDLEAVLGGEEETIMGRMRMQTLMLVWRREWVSPPGAVSLGGEEVREGVWEVVLSSSLGMTTDSGMMLLKEDVPRETADTVEGGFRLLRLIISTAYVTILMVVAYEDDVDDDDKLPAVVKRSDIGSRAATGGGQLWKAALGCGESEGCCIPPLVCGS